MTTEKIEFIKDGTVTSPQGFAAGAVAAGIKRKKGALDLGILYSQVACNTAGVFTQVNITAAAVTLCRQKLKSGKAAAVVVNAGCANAYTGEQGLADAQKVTEMAAKGLGISASDMLIASTGVTGKLLPMDKIKAGLAKLVLSADGGHELARAIMTTDTVHKEAALAVSAGGFKYTIGGIAKGSGMIHPNMATMFCFLTTDAAVEPAFLKDALQKSAALSFNMISVDGDTSPSDTVLLMANGQAKNALIAAGSQQAEVFQRALDRICITFAKKLARDGEGATRLIEATVSGAKTPEDARAAAKTIIGSSLVKTAVHGGDPNWGRIVAAVARSGAEVNEAKIDVTIGNIAVLKSGKPLDFNEDNVIKVFKGEEVPILVNLNMGKESATAWGCDMSEEYVKINGEYMT